MKEFRKSKYNNLWNYKWVKELMMILQNHRANSIWLLYYVATAFLCWLMPNICVLNERMKDGNKQNNEKKKNICKTD